VLGSSGSGRALVYAVMDVLVPSTLRNFLVD
jgi:hypothetical protein